MLNVVGFAYLNDSSLTIYEPRSNTTLYNPLQPSVRLISSQPLLLLPILKVAQQLPK